MIVYMEKYIKLAMYKFGKVYTIVFLLMFHNFDHALISLETDVVHHMCVTLPVMCCFPTAWVAPA